MARFILMLCGVLAILRGSRQTPDELFDVMYDAFETEIDAAEDVVVSQEEAVKEAEQAEKDAQAELDAATSDEEREELEKRVESTQEQVGAATELQDEAEGMVSAAKEQVESLKETEDQRDALVGDLEKQAESMVPGLGVNGTVSNALEDQVADPLDLCSEKVKELDGKLEAMLAPHDGTTFKVASMNPGNGMQWPVRPDLEAFGHYDPDEVSKRINTNGTIVENGSTVEEAIAFVQTLDCHKEVEALKSKYGLPR